MIRCPESRPYTPGKGGHGVAVVVSVGPVTYLASRILTSLRSAGCASSTYSISTNPRPTLVLSVEAGRPAVILSATLPAAPEHRAAQIVQRNDPGLLTATPFLTLSWS